MRQARRDRGIELSVRRHFGADHRVQVRGGLLRQRHGRRDLRGSSGRERRIQVGERVLRHQQSGREICLGGLRRVQCRCQSGDLPRREVAGVEPVLSGHDGGTDLRIRFRAIRDRSGDGARVATAMIRSAVRRGL